MSDAKDKSEMEKKQDGVCVVDKFPENYIHEKEFRYKPKNPFSLDTVIQGFITCFGLIISLRNKTTLCRHVSPAHYDRRALGWDFTVSNFRKIIDDNFSEITKVHTFGWNTKLPKEASEFMYMLFGDSKFPLIHVNCSDVPGAKMFSCNLLVFVGPDEKPYGIIEHE